MAKRRFKTEVAPNTVEREIKLTRAEIKSFYVRSNLPTVIAWAFGLAAGIVATCFTVYGVIVILFSVGYLAVQLGRAIAAFKRSVRDPSYSDAVTVEMTEDGLTTVRDNRRGVMIPWLSMAKIVKTRTTYLVRISSKQTIILPLAAYTAQEQDWIDKDVVPVVKNRKKILMKMHK